MSGERNECPDFFFLIPGGTSNGNIGKIKLPNYVGGGIAVKFEPDSKKAGKAPCCCQVYTWKQEIVKEWHWIWTNDTKPDGLPQPGQFVDFPGSGNNSNAQKTDDQIERHFRLKLYCDSQAAAIIEIDWHIDAKVIGPEFNKVGDVTIDISGW